MAEDALTIKAFMVREGIVSNESELDWLTDEYLSQRSEREKPDIGTMEGVPLSYTDYGNHFYTTNGGRVWHWDSGDNVPGGNLACGRNNSWMYNVRQGDTYGTAGNCPGGYPYYRLEIYH